MHLLFHNLLLGTTYASFSGVSCLRCGSSRQKEWLFFLVLFAFPSFAWFWTLSSVFQSINPRKMKRSRFDRKENKVLWAFRGSTGTKRKGKTNTYAFFFQRKRLSKSFLLFPERNSKWTHPLPLIGKIRLPSVVRAVEDVLVREKKGRLLFDLLSRSCPRVTSLFAG